MKTLKNKGQENEPKIDYDYFGIKQKDPSEKTAEFRAE
jgi:hypothetical protein